MQISIIAAMTANMVIGHGNKLPWHIPAELQHFKAATMGKPMIMGRTTFDSIGRRLLPGRTTIVLTKDAIVSENLQTKGLIIANTIAQALQLAGDVTEVMIVGGASIYQQFLPIAHKMYLSIIHQDYAGNVFFPAYDFAAWQLTTEERHSAFTVKTFEKIT